MKFCSLSNSLPYVLSKIKKVDPLPNLHQLISLLFVITPRFILAKFHFYLSSHYYYNDSRNLYFRFILLFREYLVLFESVNTFIFSIQRTCTYLTLLALLPFIRFIIIMTRLPATIALECHIWSPAMALHRFWQVGDRAQICAWWTQGWQVVIFSQAMPSYMPNCWTIHFSSFAKNKR